MDSKNYLYLIGIIIVLFFLSYPSQGTALLRPKTIPKEAPSSTQVVPVDTKLTSTESSFRAVPATDTLLIGNRNGVKLSTDKQAIDVTKSDIVLYTGTTESTERLRVVGSTGFVGIGKTNPTSTLDINGAISADDFVVRRNYSIMGNYGIGTTNPLVPLQVVGTTATTTLLASDKVGIGVTNPVAPLQVSGTIVANKMGLGTASPNTSLDVLESMHYIGKQFKVGGTPDKYYPVIVDASFSYISGKYEFGICRGYVHLDQDWHGVLNFYVEGKPYYCGHAGHYLKWRLTQRPGGPVKYQRMVAGLGEPYCAPEIVVWLLGNTTYYFTGFGCKLKDGNTSGIDLRTADNALQSIRTTIEPYMDAEVCSGDNLSNIYTLGPKIGIGLTTPRQALDVTGNIVTDWGDRQIGSQYTDGSGYFLGMTTNIAPRLINIVCKSGDETGGITFQTGATPTEKMRITLAGNVGIGTTAPLHALDIYGGTGSLSIRHPVQNVRVSTYANSGPYGAIEAHYDSAPHIKLPLALNAWGGNVGIGVTNPLQGRLQVAGRGMIGYIENYRGGVLIDNEDAYGGHPCIQSVTSGLGTNNLVINPNGGNVGIGVTNPVYFKLDVAGNFRCDSINTGVVNAGTINGSKFTAEDRRWSDLYFSPADQFKGTVSFLFTGGGAVGNCDSIQFNTYVDPTGGNQNLVCFDKGQIGMRIWQGPYQSGARYSRYKDCVMTNENSPNVTVNGILASSSQLAVINSAPWDHIRMWHTGSAAMFEAGGAESGIVFRVNNGGTGFPADPYNDVMRLNTTGTTFYNGLTIMKEMTTVGDNSMMIKYYNTAGGGYYDWAIGAAVVSEGAAFCIRGGTSNEDVDGMTNLITVSPSGYLGIGIFPTFPLTVNPIGGNVNGWSILFYNNNSPYSSIAETPYKYNISIWAQGSIYTNLGLFVGSDSRIKKDVTNLNYGLQTIKRLRPITYTHIDVIENGSNPQVGFIAQEVKEVVPELVSVNSDFICDAYDKFTIIERETGKVTVSLHKPLEWEVGSTIKMAIKSSETEDKTKTLSSATILSISSYSCTISLGEDIDVYDTFVFLYGKKVDDFHTVAYEKLTPILTKATQELSDQVDSIKAEVLSLRTENAELKSTLSSLLQWARFNGFSG